VREAIADAPPQQVMLALSDLLQEYLTRLVMAEPSGPRDERCFADSASGSMRGN
jgi:hypothetical protein